MKRLAPRLLLLIALSSCGPEGVPGYYEITLTDTIWNRKEHRMKLIIDSTGQETARLDTLEGWDNIVRTQDGDLVRMDVRAADVRLGPDSVRIALINLLGMKDFVPGRDYSADPDYLLVTDVGREQLNFRLGRQGNIGPVSSRTAFRIGEHDYRLRSVDSSRSHLVVEMIEGGHNLPLTLSYQTRYRAINVLDPAGEPAVIRREKDKKLALCFFPSYRWEEMGLVELDRILARARAPADWQVAVVISSYNNASIDYLRERYGITTPLFIASNKTFRNLNPTAGWPFVLETDANGRIVTYRREFDDFLDDFRGVQQSEATSRPL